MWYLWYMDPFSLDWGPVPPEGYNQADNTALYVFNLAVKPAVAQSRAITFIAGRVAWCRRHLPPGCAHLVHVDARGQLFGIKAVDALKAALTAAIARNGVDLDVRVEVLFG